MRSKGIIARVVATLAVAAAPLAVAPAPAAAETGVEITIGINESGTPEAALSQTGGDVDLVGTVKGVVGGTSLDLERCAVHLDPATLTQGTGAFALTGCAGSDAAVRVAYRVSEEGRLVGTASSSGSGGAERPITWSVECDVYWVLGLVPVVHCKIRVSGSA